MSPRQVLISTLKPHPRNYRKHPEDQLEHIRASIAENGFYRNVVIVKDGTILAGHGVVKAAESMGRDKVPAVRLPIDPDSPAAIKILTGDNEISHLGIIDDRELTELLGDIPDLLGTGYDGAMLANLVYTTRPQSEIKDMDEASAWADAGMPPFDPGGKPPVRLAVSFRNEADRLRFVEKFELTIMKKEACTWSVWWPDREREDAAAVRYEG